MFLLGGYASIAWKPGSKFTYARDKNGKVIDSNHPEHDKISAIENNGYWSITTKKFDECRKNYPEFDDPEYESKSAAIDKDWEDNYKGEAKWVYVEKPSPRIFEFDGELWHHLENGLKQHQILGRHGSWVKSSAQDFRVALETEMHVARVDEAKFAIKQGIMPSTKSPFRYYCKDHLEVFIEKL